MIPIFQCIFCKTELTEENYCKKCHKNFFNKNGFYDFILDSTNNIDLESDMSKLLQNVQDHGYSKSIKSFFKNSNTKFEEKFSAVEGDIAFRCINKKNLRCLIINSELGNICENLSKIFEQVFSMEYDETKILIQNIRFKENEIKNIVLVRSNYLALPFKKEYFDLVIFNGINIKEKSKVIQCFQDVKRVLKPSGCFCVGALNKFKLEISSNESDNLTKNMYADSHSGYSSIFKNLNFHVRSFWIFGTFRRPYFIGDMEDELSLKWIFSNLKIFFPINIKSKIFACLLNKSNTTIRKILIKFFSHSFLFYCYKGDNHTSEFEEMLKEKTGVQSFLQQIRLKNLQFILFNTNGKPIKKFSCKRTNYDLTENVVSANLSPKNDFSDTKMIVQDWIEGRPINIKNIDEIQLVIEWLINFQTKTSTDLYTIDIQDNELTIIKNHLKTLSFMENLPYQTWLDDYKKYVNKMKIKNTSVHGDFVPHNILYNSDTSSVHVIDWEQSSEHGNPFYDITKFIFHMLTPNTTLIEFSNNLKNLKNIPSLVTINEILSNHYKHQLDIIILLRFYLLHQIVFNKNINKSFFSKLLVELSKYTLNSIF